MKSQIAAAHTATSSSLSEASSLMTQRRQVEQKQDLLRAFRSHFVLSEDEIASLTLSSEPVDDTFFSVLAKTKKISRDCEVLLGFSASSSSANQEEDGGVAVGPDGQTLGLEITEQTSRYLNLAFQKLYRWVQREFTKSLNLEEENPQIGSSIRRALRVLAERPSLFQNCLDFFAEARENILSDAFYVALTGRSASSGVVDEEASAAGTKPIELVAHDPLRYVGDMLAWCHSAAVGEREALEVLFVSDGDEIAKGIQAGRDNEVWRLVEDDDEDEDGISPGTTPADRIFNPILALNQLVDRDMSGALRILRQRVEQVIQTNEETILAYKLANLLNFYKITFSKLLSSGLGSGQHQKPTGLVDSLAALEAEALRQFRSLARDHVATLQGEFQHTPADLRPPDFLGEALEQLFAIMKTYDSSLASSGDGDERETEFEPILAEAFDPFMTGCENMARAIVGGSPVSGSMFMINCLLAARRSLSKFEFTSKRAAKLQAGIEEERKRLVESQYAFFRSESGLEELISALGPLDENKETDVERLAGLEQVQAPALTRASQALDEFLPSALMDAMENLRLLQDARLARDVTEEAAERFCVDFEHVEELLMAADELSEKQRRRGGGSESEGEDEDEERQSLRALFPRTTGEIRVLLS